MAAKNTAKANNNVGLGNNHKAPAANNQKANNNGSNAQAKNSKNNVGIGAATVAPATEASTGPLHAGVGVGNNNPVGAGSQPGGNPGAGSDFGDDMAPIDDMILEDDMSFEDPEDIDDSGATDPGAGDEGTAPVGNPADPAQNPDLAGSTTDPGATDPGDFTDDSGGVSDEGLGEEIEPMGSAPTYVVQPGDTLSGIAAQNGMSLSEIVALNPEITNPSMIFPGQSVKIGAAGAVSDDMGGTDIMSDEDMLAEGGMAADEDFLGDDSIEGGIESDFADTDDSGFPKSSSYPPSENTEKVQAVLGGKLKTLGSRLKGWGVGTSPTDPAKKAMYVSSQRNTNPLDIKDKKQN